MATDPGIRATALNRYRRLSRLATTARATVEGLHDEFEEVRGAVARAESNFHGLGIGRYFRLEVGPSGEAVGIQEVRRAVMPGPDQHGVVQTIEHDIKRFAVPEFDAQARALLRQRAKLTELTAMRTAAGERWQAFARVRGVAKEILVNRGWLSDDDDDVNATVVGEVR